MPPQKLFLLLALFALECLSVRHFIPHSHQDLGWLRTIDQYYEQFSRKIYSSVLLALEAENGASASNFPNTSRKFVFAEVGFLRLFLNEDPASRPSKVARIAALLKARKLEFVNGGFSQADSACPTYEDLLENFFAGQRFLKLALGAESSAAWQIDPFGQSKALLFLARKLGARHAVINRIGDQLKAERQQSGQMQFRYVFPDNSDIIVHVTSNGYAAPDGISCDCACHRFLFNHHYFRKYLQKVDGYYKYEPFHLVGEDFHFSQAQDTFEYLDFVLRFFSQEIKYSLFSEYASTIDAHKNELPVFSEDFFVYSDGDFYQDHWSGYFTTKPRLKHRIRKAGKLLRAVKAFAVKELLTGQSVTELVKTTVTENLTRLTEDFGILLHHDTITGTSLSNVDSDFHRLLDDLEANLAGAFALKFGKGVFLCDTSETLAELRPCLFEPKENEENLFFVYNPSLMVGPQLISLVVKGKSLSEATVELSRKKPSEAKIEFNLVCEIDRPLCQLFFKDSLSPFSTSEYILVFRSELSIERFSNGVSIDDGRKKSLVKSRKFSGEASYLFSDFSLTVTANSVVYKSSDPQVPPLELFYQWIDAGESGHYLLKYNGRLDFRPYNEALIVRVIKGSLVEGVYVQGSKIDFKLLKQRGKDFFSLESLVKLSPELAEGADILLNVKAKGISSKGFVTDSNGLFEMQRSPNTVFEKSVFPVTSFIKIQDEGSGAGLEVFNDRAQGATSDLNGGVKIYIQRSGKIVKPEILKVNESVFLRHTIFPFKAQNANYKNTRTEILKAQINEILVLHFSNKEKSNLPILDSADLKFGDASDLKFNFDIIDKGSIITRVQNLNRYQEIAIDLRKLFSLVFGEVKMQEVEFDYFLRAEANEIRPMADSYRIQSLEFKTFLMSL